MSVFAYYTSSASSKWPDFGQSVGSFIAAVLY